MGVLGGGARAGSAFAVSGRGSTASQSAGVPDHREGAAIRCRAPGSAQARARRTRAQGHRPTISRRRNLRRSWPSRRRYRCLFRRGACLISAAHAWLGRTRRHGKSHAPAAAAMALPGVAEAGWIALQVMIVGAMPLLRGETYGRLQLSW